ncbi:hypothetical protein [Nitrosospira sp. Nsp18]|uniref:hypothetical protein n=1 Tax=Nitrosospira sp. Nsp18 TaxID=1855334 RepID=UPI0015A0F749|nr:hypothetical protein [Nitrosospira sp. Nsp18]
MRGPLLTVLAPDSIYFDGGAEVFEQAWYFRGKHGPYVMLGHGRDPCAGLWERT